MPKVQRKKKILIPIHKIEDPGGIINWVEHLCHGLKQNNCDVTLVRPEYKRECKAKGFSIRDTLKTYSGIEHEQRWGWYFPKENRIPLQSTDWIAYTDQFDLVIWAVPVPAKTRRFYKWKDLYDIRTPQIMVIHDGNLNNLYDCAYEVMDKCSRVVGVHDCSFNSIKHPNKELIPNPQVLRLKEVNYGQRTNYIFSVQTFKRWKRVDSLIRAIPHLKSSKLMLAGCGIEYYYMTSPGRRKEEYGNIWEDAENSGNLDYLGAIDEETRDIALAGCKLLIDPSWSKSYAKIGSHFNRSFVDAVMAGCLPSGTDLLMDGNSFFNPDDYVTIPYDLTPEDYAEMLDMGVGIERVEYERRLKNLQRVVVEKFDSVKVAAQYLKYSR